MTYCTVTLSAVRRVGFVSEPHELDEPANVGIALLAIAPKTERYHWIFKELVDDLINVSGYHFKSIVKLYVIGGQVNLLINQRASQYLIKVNGQVIMLLTHARK